MSQVIRRVFDYEVPFTIPNSAAVTATSYTNQFQPVVFDKSEFNGFSEIVFRCDITQGNGGTFEGFVRLFDLTGFVEYATTELSADLAQFAHSIEETGDISDLLAAGANLYTIEVRAESGGSITINNPSIVVRY